MILVAILLIVYYYCYCVRHFECGLIQVHLALIRVNSTMVFWYFCKSLTFFAYEYSRVVIFTHISTTPYLLIIVNTLVEAPNKMLKRCIGLFRSFIIELSNSCMKTNHVTKYTFERTRNSFFFRNLPTKAKSNKF